MEVGGSLRRGLDGKISRCRCLLSLLTSENIVLEKKLWERCLKAALNQFTSIVSRCFDELSLVVTKLYRGIDWNLILSQMLDWQSFSLFPNGI